VGFLSTLIYLSLIFENFNNAMLDVKQSSFNTAKLVGNEFLRFELELFISNNDSSRLILNLAAASSSPLFFNIKKIISNIINI